MKLVGWRHWMDIIGLLGRQDNHHWGGILEFQIWETLGINNVKVATSSQQLMQVNSLDIWYHCIDNHYWGCRDCLSDMSCQCCMEPNIKDEHYKRGAQYKRVSFIGEPFIFHSAFHRFHDYVIIFCVPAFRQFSLVQCCSLRNIFDIKLLGLEKDIIE